MIYGFGIEELNNGPKLYNFLDNFYGKEGSIVQSNLNQNCKINMNVFYSEVFHHNQLI